MDAIIRTTANWLLSISPESFMAWVGYAIPVLTVVLIMLYLDEFKRFVAWVTDTLFRPVRRGL